MKLLLKDESGAFRVIADSAIGRTAQPWFMPDFGCNWRWRKAIAHRVCKLGKGVSAGFAGRYFDAVTLLWVPEADDNSAADYMDGAVVCGNWIETSDFDPEVVDALIEVSKTSTVKNGDIIARMLPDEAEPVMINSHVALRIGEREVLGFNIK